MTQDKIQTTRAEELRLIEEAIDQGKCKVIGYEEESVIRRRFLPLDPYSRIRRAASANSKRARERSYKLQGLI